MTVLFIVHDLYQEDNHFPLNIAYLAAVLKQANIDVEVLCQDIYHHPNWLIADHLKQNTYDMICLSFLSARYRETILPLCKVINKYKKDAWLVLGGHGASATPEFILEETQADVVFVGEAESSILSLLEKPTILPTIIYGKPIRELDSIPFPQWDLFPIERYSTCLKYPGMNSKDKILAMITSRGCINRCNFCFRLEKGLRIRSIKNVVEEMAYLNEYYGITYFNFYDECFGYPKKRIFEFQDELERCDLEIKYYCAARVDLMDKEGVHALKESGCKFLNFGLESSHQTVLDFMHKNTTVEQNIKAIELAKNEGIDIGLNLIWGNLGDTKQSLLDNVELIKKYNSYAQLRTIRPVTPYPGCELYYHAIEEGLLNDPKDFYDSFKNSDLFTVNFMDIPLDEAYEALYEANEELVYDHYVRNLDDLDLYKGIVKGFENLYFKHDYTFRGARHYGKG